MKGPCVDQDYDKNAKYCDCSGQVGCGPGKVLPYEWEDVGKEKGQGFVVARVDFSDGDVMNFGSEIGGQDYE